MATAASLRAVTSTGQLVFGSDRVVITKNDPACQPCHGWSGGQQRKGCWYVGAPGASCASVCSTHGGIDSAAWAHEGNPVCKIFFSERNHGGNTAPIECCSADTDFGANGQPPSACFSDPACRLACACKN
jgi:hypothetical protein